MRVQQPKPFFFEEQSEYAVLLLHGFTGNSSDVRQFGRYLQKQGIASMAPIYDGHGESPEALLRSNPHLWWRDVLHGYDELKAQGFEHIAVAGISLGGLMGLKLSLHRDVFALSTMCSPTRFKTEDEMFNKFVGFARQFKQLEGKSHDTIEREVNALTPTSMISDLLSFMEEVVSSLDDIMTPIYIAQGSLDTVIDIDSAEDIYNGVFSDIKEKKYYEQSGHIITQDKQKNQLFDDVLTFINTQFSE